MTLLVPVHLDYTNAGEVASTGYVDFTLTGQAAGGASTTVRSYINSRMRATLSSGVQTIDLLPNDTVGLVPNSFYLVEEHIDGQVNSKPYKIVVLTSMAGGVQLALLRGASSGSPPNPTTLYTPLITWQTSNGFAHPDGTTITQDPDGTLHSAGGASAGHIIEDEGTPLTARTHLNFTGAGVTASDNSGADSTDVTIPGPPVSSVNALTGAVVLDDSNINAQDPSTGGTVRTLRAVLSNLWAAITARLLAANNLSDLADKPTARTTLGLGTSATRNVGTTTGTVAAGDDSRWVTSQRLETSFTATGDAYYQADSAETWDLAATANGTFSHYKALAASPTTFSAAGLPVTLAAGDWLKLSCTALNGGWAGEKLKRTA